MSNSFTENSDLELGSLYYKIFNDAKPKANSITTKVEPDVESKVDSPEIRDFANLR